MKNEKMLSAIGKIDDHLIYNAIHDNTKKKKHIWTKVGSIAACICLLLGGLFLLQDNILTPPNDGNGNDAYLSAEEVGQLFGAFNGGATLSYTKVYTPENVAPEFALPPNDEYVNIYKINNPTQPLKKAELYGMEERIFPQLATALGYSVESFEREESFHDDSVHYLEYQKDEMHISFEQYSGEEYYHPCDNRVLIYDLYKPLTLCGKTVQVDQTQSKAEILASLEWVRDELFAIFGCNFDTAEIRCHYDDTHQYGGSCQVYYYNKADGIPYRGEGGGFYKNDFIELRFDNSHKSPSEKMITECVINYFSSRRPVEDYFEVEATCKRITLEKAEKLLAKGYVFGGHSCSLCMQSQKRISFDDYDYVGFEYVKGTPYYDNPTRAVPFYAFYKKIGTAKNGNIIYAKTYVCAVEVRGLEEYYKNQKDNHYGW